MERNTQQILVSVLHVNSSYEESLSSVIICIWSTCFAFEAHALHFLRVLVRSSWITINKELRLNKTILYSSVNTILLTQAESVQWLAPSQTDSSTSKWSVYLPGCQQTRMWENAVFPLQGTGGGRVSASLQSKDRRRSLETHSSDSKGHHLENNNTGLTTLNMTVKEHISHMRC